MTLAVLIVKQSFFTLEFVMVVLPVVPSQLWFRLTIMMFYFFLHYIKAQIWYANLKMKTINILEM